MWGWGAKDRCCIVCDFRNQTCFFYFGFCWRNNLLMFISQFGKMIQLQFGEHLFNWVAKNTSYIVRRSRRYFIVSIDEGLQCIRVPLLYRLEMDLFSVPSPTFNCSVFCDSYMWTNCTILGDSYLLNFNENGGCALWGSRLSYLGKRKNKSSTQSWMPFLEGA